MIRFILGKLLYLVPTFLGITIVAFAFVRVLPGDPVLLMAGERGISPERHAQLAEQLGFAQPIWQQYLHFLGRLLQGDLGNSLVTKKPVLTEFLSLFPATVELGLVAIIIATLIGVPIGALAAIRRGSWLDQIVMTTALVGFSMPIFWWGLQLIVLFSGALQWTPVTGRISLMYFFPSVTGFMLIDSLISGQKGAFASAVSHLVLPSVVLATIPLAVIARQTRSAMLEVLGEDYVRTARFQRHVTCARRRHPCIKKCDDSGYNYHRPADWCADGRRYSDRNHLFLAGHRQVDDRFHHAP